MTNAVPMAEVWRGTFLECVHYGHAVICDGHGQIVESWGNPDMTILPRSSCKMVQALPLLTSGAAAKYGLNSEHLALACASHDGAGIHTSRVNTWLDALGLDDAALRCGTQTPGDRDAREDLIRRGQAPGQCHNFCSGKHAGFLTLAQHMGAGPEYVEFDHPVQQACLAAFEEASAESSPGYAIDGCSAPNFATTMTGLARAMGWFASAKGRSDRASAAAVDLTSAMMQHPELVAGEARACTELMRAAHGQAAIKTGAEGVYVAILPEKQMGVAVKITDGATRASECAIAAILVHLGVLDANHPAVQARLAPEILSRAGLLTGQIRSPEGFV